MTKIPNWLVDKVNSLNEQEKRDFLLDLISLSDNLEPVFGMAEPWLLIIDSQILFDLEHWQSNESDMNQRRRYIRLIAVFMIFCFLVSYSEKQIGIILTPCTFYEFNKRRVPENLKRFNNSLGKYVSLLKRFGVKKLFSSGLDNYKVTRLNLRNIIHDEKEILRLIHKLKNIEMTFDLYQSFSLDNNSEIKIYRPPFLIASQIVKQQRINLKYFDRTIIHKVIACHLENKVYSDSIKNNLLTKDEKNLLKERMKNFRHISINKTAAFAKIVKGKLKGLADIEMIQYCNISSQFSYDCDRTIYPLTFDNNLIHLLQENTSISVSIEMSGQDSQEDLENKRINFSKNWKRKDLLEESSNKTFEKRVMFYKDLDSLLF